MNTRTPEGGIFLLSVELKPPPVPCAYRNAARGRFDQNATALTVDTAGRILGLSTADVPELLRALSASAALRRLGLIQLGSGEPDSFLRTTIQIDARVLRWLCAQPGIDDRLFDCVQVLEPGGLPKSAPAAPISVTRPG
jgi:hypothetical protein